MIYDAHCHLDLMDNMLEFINEIQNSDMNLFAVGTTPKVSAKWLLTGFGRMFEEQK